jgi:hypothetical protein
MVADGDRLIAGDARLEQAAVAAVDGFLAVFVAEVNFDASDVFRKTLHGGRDDGVHMVVQALMAFDRLVGIDVNLHKLTPGCS